jgi:hypothetical protein
MSCGNSESDMNHNGEKNNFFELFRLFFGLSLAKVLCRVPDAQHSEFGSLLALAPNDQQFRCVLLQECSPLSWSNSKGIMTGFGFYVSFMYAILYS